MSVRPGLADDQSLDAVTRSTKESQFGHDFSKVSIHADNRAALSAQAINALAHTTGNHIFFGDRQYAPQTTEGRRLLAHELTHVLQQRRGYAPAHARVIADLARVPAPVVQASLRVGTPDDPLEAEADAVADRVLRMPAVGFASGVQQRCPGGCPGEGELRRRPADEEDEEEVRRQPIEDENREEEATLEGLVQARSAGGMAVAAATRSSIDVARGGGTGLPTPVRKFFEPRFAADLSAVRVHADGQAARLAASVNARAFTVGQDVFFGAGEFRPGTASGDRLLAHELTHTLQQSAVRIVWRLVRGDRVSCRNAAPGSPILNRIGTNDPVGELQTADQRAIGILDTAIDELTRGRREILGGALPAWPTIGDVTMQALRDRLGLDPSDGRVWTGTGARTVLTVIRRLQGARRHLAEGWLRYQCLGSTTASSHPGCTGPDCSPGDWASTCSPSNLVVLCAPFWRPATRDERALTLVHEALHIFFGEIGDVGVSRFATAGCYEQLVADLLDLGDQGVCPRAPSS